MQECLAHWIVVRRKLAPDPDAPPVGYMAQVIRNKLTDLIREREADKRAGEQEALSLDAALDGSDDGLTLADLLAEEESAQQDEAGAVDRHHARIDIGRALARLTPVQRQLCQMLGEGGADHQRGRRGQPHNRRKRSPTSAIGELDFLSCPRSCPKQVPLALKLRDASLKPS